MTDFINTNTQSCFFCNNNTDSEHKDLLNIYTKNYEPCDNCKNKMAQGITLIVVQTQPVYINQVPIEHLVNTDINLYPTGDYIVITENTITKMVIPGALKDRIIKNKKAFIKKEMLTQILSYTVED